MSSCQNLRYFQLYPLANIGPLYLILKVNLKFPSVPSHSTILNNFLSNLGNLGHPHESIVTLVVAIYSNISLVHPSPSLLKMNSKLLLLTITRSFHVDLVWNILQLNTISILSLVGITELNLTLRSLSYRRWFLKLVRPIEIYF